MSLNVVKDATCTFCGCVCDDIELHAEGDRIVKARNACSLGDAWFKNHTAERLFPDALIDGKPATVEAAIEAAADFLYEANMPLVYGLSNVTCEAQRQGRGSLPPDQAGQRLRGADHAAGSPQEAEGGRGECCGDRADARPAAGSG